MTLAAGLLAPESGSACGVFGRNEQRVPTVAYEEVLLIHDPFTEQEHFIRSVTFRADEQPFGFVVPTPSRPTVAAMQASPFAVLRAAYPFESYPDNGDYGLYESEGNRGFGKGHGRLGAGVMRVLEVRRVGSFMAFVLSASDQGALTTWLRENGFATTPTMEGWLAGYVRMGFHFVAFRYEPRSASRTAVAGSFRAETVRVSFKTPLPYYPYSEPLRSDRLEGDERVVELWVASPMIVTPVALRQTSGRGAWVRPMRPGFRYAPPDPTQRGFHLEGEYTALMPPHGVDVQTFQDQKVHRTGLGDIVFVPVGLAWLPLARETLLPLAGLLDPELLPPAAGAP